MWKCENVKLWNRGVFVKYEIVKMWKCENVKSWNRGACMEKFGNCQYFNNFAQNLSKEELLDLSTRYDKYNEMILSRQK